MTAMIAATVVHVCAGHKGFGLSLLMSLLSLGLHELVPSELS